MSNKNFEMLEENEGDNNANLGSALGVNYSPSTTAGVQEDPLTAIDVVNDIRELLLDVTTDTTDAQLANKMVKTMELVDKYDIGVLDDAKKLKALTQEQASDKTIQAIGHQYGMTLNQVVGYLDICEQLNNDKGLQDCGVVAVPFWFHSQFNEMKELNEQLTQETDSLMCTIASVKKNVPKSQLESLGLELPERKSIITGVTQPYIPGVTGARLGDEHLDKDNVYLGDVRRK